MKFALILLICSINIMVLPITIVRTTIIDALDALDAVYDRNGFLVPMILLAGTGVVGLITWGKRTKMILFIFSALSICLAVILASAFTCAYVREIVGKQCTYDSNNHFELDQVEGNNDKHNYDLLCEDAKRTKANAILLYCITYLCSLVVNMIVVVVLCIDKLNCSRPDINTSTPIKEAEKNPRPLMTSIWTIEGNNIFQSSFPFNSKATALFSTDGTEFTDPVKPPYPTMAGNLQMKKEGYKLMD